jgi:hypothetical protein
MTTNDVTGDALRTRIPSDKYRENWDAIFKKEPGDTGSSLLEDRKDDSENVRTDRTNTPG